MDGTPIFDIKPYLSYVDSHPEASEGFAGSLKSYSLNIECPAELSEQIPKDKREALFALLSQDPRPSYQNDAERTYRLRFAGMEIEFRVNETTLHVISVEKIS